MKTPQGLLQLRSSVERLKSETRVHHERIEAVVPILRPDADVNVYSGYLRKLLGFHLVLEPGLLSRMREGLPHWEIEDRLKAPLLRADLQALGVSELELSAVPRCAQLPSIDTLGRALGCMYVLEGATLGGKVIHRQLSARSPELMARASRYLPCYGAETGQKWKSLTQLLEEQSSESARAAQIVLGAIETFELLREWIALPGSRE